MYFLFDKLLGVAPNGDLVLSHKNSNNVEILRYDLDKGSRVIWIANRPDAKIQFEVGNPSKIDFDRRGNAYIGDLDECIYEYDDNCQQVTMLTTANGAVSTLCTVNEMVYYCDDLYRNFSGYDTFTKGLMWIITDFADRNSLESQLPVMTATDRCVVNPTAIVRSSQNDLEFFFACEVVGVFKFNISTYNTQLLLAGTFMTCDTIYGPGHNVNKVTGLVHFEEDLYFADESCVKKLNLKSGHVEAVVQLGSSIKALFGDPVHHHCLYASTTNELFMIH